ncbi:MAG: hypothetical protein AAF408_05135 [Pseudomonadota bacterium]
MAQDQQAIVAVAVAIIVLMFNLGRDASYRTAYADWLSFRDPLGSKLWTRHFAKHLSPFVFGAITFVALSMIALRPEG